MLSDCFVKTYLNVFHKFGLSSYNPNECDTTSPVGTSIPSFCYLIIACICGIMSFDNFSHLKVNFDNCIYAIFIILMVVTAAMVFERASFSHGNARNIWKHFIELKELLSNRIEMKIDFRQFNQRYIFKLSLMLFSFGALVTIKILHRFNSENFIRQTGTLVLQFLALLAMCQILFYVSFFNYVLNSINRHIMEIVDLDQCIEDVEFIDDLGPKIMFYYQILKLIHFKLWEILQLINDDFGGLLTILIIEKSNTSVQTIYWVIVELIEDDFTTNLRIISKHSLIIQLRPLH